MKQDSIDFVADSLSKDISFIHNYIKGEIAGARWGKDEAASIKLKMDSQIKESLKHFDEADAFIQSLN